MKSKFFNIFFVFLITLTLYSCSSLKSFSFYNFFINPDVSELILDEELTAIKPDIESVPEKLEINE